MNQIIPADTEQQKDILWKKYLSKKVQIKDVSVGNGLRFQFFQSILKGSPPELVIAKRDHDRQVAGDQLTQQGRKQAHLCRANGVPRHYNGIRENLGNTRRYARHKRGQLLPVDRVNDRFGAKVKVGKAEEVHIYGIWVYKFKVQFLL